VTENTVPPDRETMLELFRQSSENARAYMDLRFKHFTTFMVVTALLGTAIFKVNSLESMRCALTGIAVTLSILFWLLDYRAAQHQKTQLARIAAYEKILNVPAVQEPRFRILLRASNATNLIFATITICWSIVAWGNC